MLSLYNCCATSLCSEFVSPFINSLYFVKTVREGAASRHIHARQNLIYNPATSQTKRSKGSVRVKVETAEWEGDKTKHQQRRGGYHEYVRVYHFFIKNLNEKRAGGNCGELENEKRSFGGWEWRKTASGCFWCGGCEVLAPRRVHVNTLVLDALIKS